ncbi:MAG: GNAT family N-acetyltransferase [Pseudomonadales bacterium]
MESERANIVFLRVMMPSELTQIAEIDRSERITQQYRQRGRVLELIDVDIDAPGWGEAGEVALDLRVEEWTRMVNAGGVPIGAFDGDHLIGFAIYMKASDDHPAQLAVLHVTRPWRRRGIGCDLTGEVVRLARAENAQRLYVSATPTRGTVDFYLNQGFVPVEMPDERLFALEPDDIHMERTL